MKNKHLIFLFIFSLIYNLWSSYYFYQLVHCYEPERTIGRLSIIGGDTHSYLNTFDNYIKEGDFYFVNKEGTKVFAGRLPHYGVLYYFFRWGFPTKNAKDLLVVLQILLHSFSVIALALLAFKLTQNKLAFWLTFLIYLFSSYTSIYNIYLLPESLSTSYLIFFLYFFQRYRENQKLYLLLISSLFLALLSVLKPYLVLLYIPLGITFIINSKLNLIEIIKKTVISSLFLLIFISPWTIRNYVLFDKFIPFQENMTAGYNYTDSELACRKFIKAWGGNIVHWDPKNAGCYFIKSGLGCSFQLPQKALTDSYDESDVEEVRHLFFELQENYSDSLDTIVSNKFDSLTIIYKSERPFQYYILTPLTFLRKFLIQSNTYNLPIHPSFPCYNFGQQVYKIAQYLLYYLILLLGNLGIIFYFLKKKDFLKISFIHFIPYLYAVVFFAIVLQAVEWRYFTQTFPILVLWAVLFINHLIIQVFTKPKM